MYKVIIVDDENIIRRGIVSLIPWSELDCEVAAKFSNGLDVVSYLRDNHADIVVSDVKMPGMDGIQLAEYVCNNYPKLKLIILSAYSDFEYAKQAIRFRVFDFIVKNGFAKEIPVVVKKAIDAISRENEESSKLAVMQRAAYEGINDIKEKVILEYLLGYLEDVNEIKRKFKALDITLDNYLVITCEILAEDQLKPESNIHANIKRFISLGLGDFFHVSLVAGKELISTVVSLKEADGKTLKLVEGLCSNIMLMIGEFLQIDTRFGVNSVHSRLDELSAAYRESKSALASAFGNDKNISTFAELTPSQKAAHSICTYKHAEKVVNSLKDKDISEAGKALEHLFNEYMLKNLTVEEIKISALSISASCFMLLSDYQIYDDIHIEKEKTIYKKINECKSIKSLQEIIYDNIRYIFDAIKTSKSNRNQIVLDVDSYLRENYNRQITLKGIALSLHVSSSYLSRLYKRERGETIIDALNKMRIEVAKKLLKDTTIRISEVANEVGFDDPAYFTHVFIKYVGSTPKDFKTK